MGRVPNEKVEEGCGHERRHPPGNPVPDFHWVPLHAASLSEKPADSYLRAFSHSESVSGRTRHQPVVVWLSVDHVGHGRDGHGPCGL